MKTLTGSMLDKLSDARVMGVTWNEKKSLFEISGSGFGHESVTMTPNELADLSRELMQAAVTKGSVIK